MMNASFPDRRREHRTEPVPPEPYCFVADINAPLEQEILDLSQRKRITDVHHHREANYLRRTVEITEGILHPRRLRNATPQLKPICSDKAQTRHQHHGHHPADRSDEGIDAPFFTRTRRRRCQRTTFQVPLGCRQARPKAFSMRPPTLLVVSYSRQFCPLTVS